MTKSFTRRQRIGYFFCPFGLLLLYVAGALLFGLVVKTSVQAQFLDNLLLIVVGACWIFLEQKRRQHSSCKDVFQPKVWAVFLFLVLCVVVAIFFPVLGQYVNLHMMDTGREVYHQTVSEDYGLYLLMSVFIAPIAEEYLFRMWMYPMWKKAFHGPVIAMLLTSVMFALIHGTMAHLPVAFFLSIFMCITYEITGQIRYCSLIHFIFNLVGVVIVPGLFTEKSVLLSTVGVVLLTCVIIVWLLLYYLLRNQIRTYVTTDHLIDKWNRKFDE